MSFDLFCQKCYVYHFVQNQIILDLKKQYSTQKKSFIYFYGIYILVII